MTPSTIESDPSAEVSRALYSVVIPVYGSAAILPDLVRRLDAFFDTHGHRKELIFVVDGSPDQSWQVLQRLKQEPKQGTHRHCAHRPHA